MLSSVLLAILILSLIDIAGNMGQLMGPNSWSFHRYLSETFGSAVKVRWLFNVSFYDSFRAFREMFTTHTVTEK